MSEPVIPGECERFSDPFDPYPICRVHMDEWWPCQNFIVSNPELFEDDNDE